MKILFTILLFVGWFNNGNAQSVEKRAVENTKTTVTISEDIGSDKQKENSFNEKVFISAFEGIKAVESIETKTEVENKNPNQYKTLIEAAMTPERNQQPISTENKTD